MTTFAAELRRAIDARGMSIRQTAEAAGMWRHTIDLILTKGRTPRLDTVEKLVEALDWKELRAIAYRQRRRRCPVCRRQFVTTNMALGKRRFCSDRCRQAVRYRPVRLRQHDLAKLEGKAMRKAIQSFCDSCAGWEPCRDLGGDGTGTCPLRPYSHKPFVPLTDRRQVTYGLRRTAA